MTREQAEFIAEECQGEIYKDYSGREMFGDTTWAVVIDNVLAVVMGLWDFMKSMPANPHPNEECPAAPPCLRLDEMGKQLILY